LGPCESKAFFF